MARPCPTSTMMLTTVVVAIVPIRKFQRDLRYIPHQTHGMNSTNKPAGNGLGRRIYVQQTIMKDEAVVA